MKINSPYRTVKMGANTNVESIIMEFSIGAIFFVLAFSDWGNGKTILFWPCLIVAGLCFFLVLHSLISMVLDKLDSGKIKEDDIEDQRPKK